MEHHSTVELTKLESWWLQFGLVMLVVFFSVVVTDAALTIRGTPVGMNMIDPVKVRTTTPFDHPGIYQRDGKNIDVAIIASAFQFQPAEITVPVGSTVHFHLASTDVVHGFLIPGKTNVNAMVLPGHVTEVSQRFSKAGRYLVLCDEYCGTEHQHMQMHIVVTGGNA